MVVQKKDVLKVRITEGIFYFSSDVTDMMVDYYCCPLLCFQLKQFGMDLRMGAWKFDRETEHLKSRLSMILQPKLSLTASPVIRRSAWALLSFPNSLKSYKTCLIILGPHPSLLERIERECTKEGKKQSGERYNQHLDLSWSTVYLLSNKTEESSLLKV